MKYKREFLKSLKSSFWTITGAIIGILLVRFFFNSKFHGLPEVKLYFEIYILAFIITTLISTIIEIIITKRKRRKN